MTDVTRTPEDIVEALTAFPSELTRLVNDQSHDALMAPGSDGAPGVVEILPNLHDWEQIFGERVRAILTEDNPSLPAFDDELWAIERDYRGQDPAKVLKAFLTLRAGLLDRLDGLGAAAWSRTGDHETYGEVTLAWVIEQIVESDANHLAQVRDALS